MTNITAQLVKELRDKTGAGMMDCKTALTETNGDMEAAADWLRKKGITKAAKKQDRVAAQGLIGVTSDGRTGALVEVNSETDFVARNGQFQDMVQKIVSLAPKANGNLAALLGAKYPGTGNTVEAQVKDAIATIGENMGVRRTAALAVRDGVVASYIHNKAGEGIGKIGVLVALESAGDNAKLAEFGRQLAMHVAASSPLALTPADLDKAAIDKERALYTEQALATGKPKEIVDKIVEGRLKKEFFQQACLMSQVFVLDGKSSVEEVVKATEKDAGAPIKVKGFIRYALGEGIERKQEDFAAEVAKTVGAAGAQPAPAAAKAEAPKIEPKKANPKTEAKAAPARKDAPKGKKK